MSLATDCWTARYLFEYAKETYKMSLATYNIRQALAGGRRRSRHALNIYIHGQCYPAQPLAFSVSLNQRMQIPEEAPNSPDQDLT